MYLRSLASMDTTMPSKIALKMNSWLICLEIYKIV